MAEEYQKLKSRIFSYKSYWKKKGMPTSLFPEWQSEINKDTPPGRLEEISQEFEDFKQSEKNIYGDVIVNDEQVRAFTRLQNETNETIHAQLMQRLKEEAEFQGEAPPPNPPTEEYQYTKALVSFKSASDLNEYVERLKRERDKSYEERWYNPQVRENLSKAIKSEAERLAGGNMDLTLKANSLADFLTITDASGEYQVNNNVLARLFFGGHWNFEYVYTRDELESMLWKMYDDIRDDPEASKVFDELGFSEEWQE